MEEEGRPGFEEGGVPETATSDRQAEAPLDQGGSAYQDNVNDDTKERSSQMKFGKITLILGLVVAVVAVFVEIPYVFVALAVLGLIVGITDDSDQVTVLVTALALMAVHGALNEVPAVGTYITGILGGVSSLINAAALAVIVKGIVARVS